MNPKQDPCPRVAAREASDRKRGRTTSDASKDFIRRTCPCDHCKKNRRTIPVRGGVR